MCMGSANRDESRWPDPNTFAIRGVPPRPLAFAAGIHMCLVMQFGHAETRVMLSTCSTASRICFFVPDD